MPGTKGPIRGLYLNPQKSLVWSDSPDADPLKASIPNAGPSAFILLGAPVGDIPFSAETIDQRISKIEEILEKLPNIDDAQAEFALLCQCFRFPKFSFCLCTSYPRHLQTSYRAFDSIQSHSLGLILGRNLDDWDWCHACLPVRLGGTGLRSAEMHAPAAYIASIGVFIS